MRWIVVIDTCEVAPDCYIRIEGDASQFPGDADRVMEVAGQIGALRCATINGVKTPVAVIKVGEDAFMLVDTTDMRYLVAARTPGLHYQFVDVGARRATIGYTPEGLVR